MGFTVEELTDSCSHRVQLPKIIGDYARRSQRNPWRGHGLRYFHLTVSTQTPGQVPTKVKPQDFSLYISLVLLFRLGGGARKGVLRVHCCLCPFCPFLVDKRPCMLLCQCAHSVRRGPFGPGRSQEAPAYEDTLQTQS